MPAGRPARRLVALIAAALLLLACGGGEPDAPAFVPVLQSSDTAVGPARLILTLQSSDPAFSLDPAAELQLRLLDAIADGFRFRAAHAPQRVAAGADEFLIATVDFDAPGFWAVEVVASLPGGGRLVSGRLRFEVDDQPDVRRPGDDAIPSPTDTLAERPLDQLTADPVPDPALYARSLAEILAAGEPALIVFATTRACPRGDLCQRALDQVKRLRVETGIAALHSEPLDLEPDGSVLPADSGVLVDWRLASDPWIFVVDANGTVAGSFELVASEAELRASVEAVLGG